MSKSKWAKPETLTVLTINFQSFAQQKRLGCNESKSLHSGDFKSNEAEKEAYLYK